MKRKIKIAIIGDIHGNLCALSAVMEHLTLLGVDMIFCLGDIIGYGPYPFECWELITKDRRMMGVLKGNHEDMLINPQKIYRCQNELVEAGIRHCQKFFTINEYLSIRKLPELVTYENFLTLAHGSFRGDYPWNYLEMDNEELLDQELNSIDTTLGVVGHTHVPMLYNHQRGHHFKLECPEKDFEFELQPDNQYLINPGSVGQPRNQDPRATYCLLELSNGKIRVTWPRVEYDIAKTIIAARECGLPEKTGLRLLAGW